MIRLANRGKQFVFTSRLENSRYLSVKKFARIAKISALKITVWIVFSSIASINRSPHVTLAIIFSSFSVKGFCGNPRLTGRLGFVIGYITASMTSLVEGSDFFVLNATLLTPSHSLGASTA